MATRRFHFIFFTDTVVAGWIVCEEKISIVVFLQIYKNTTNGH